LKEAGLVIQEQHHAVRWIKQCFSAAWRMFDTVVNRVFAISFKDPVTSIRHIFPFYLGDLDFWF
jgi:hypothetical protein